MNDRSCANAKSATCKLGNFLSKRSSSLCSPPLRDRSSSRRSCRARGARGLGGHAMLARPPRLRGVGRGRDARYAVEIVRAHRDGRGSVRGDDGLSRHHGASGAGGGPEALRVPRADERRGDAGSPRRARRASSERDAGANAVADNYRAVVATAALRFPEGARAGVLPGRRRVCRRRRRRRVRASAEERPRTSSRSAREALASSADAPEAAAKMPAAAPRRQRVRCRCRTARRGAAESRLAYRRGGTAGFARARCAPARRCWRASRVRLVDESSDAAWRAVARTRATPLGSRADAAAAKALFRVVELYRRWTADVGVSKERQRASEEMWLVVSGRALRRHDETDIAYVLAERAGGRRRARRGGGGPASSFSARRTRARRHPRARAFVWRLSGCAGLARRWRLLMEAFGVTPHRRVGGGSGAAARASSARPRRRWRSRSSRSPGTGKEPVKRVEFV